MVRRLTPYLCVLVGLAWCRSAGPRKYLYEELKDGLDLFTKPGVTSYSELLFDIPRYQLVVGAREYLFRLSLEGLKVLDESHWPAAQSNVTMCRQKGQTEEDCHNFIRVLVSHNSRLFTCGTNAFSPECSWRDINNLNTVSQWESGVAKCPYSPHYNSTALMTVQGSYYIASALDFSAQDYAIYRIMGKGPLLRTVQYDPKWLNEPNFVASYEIENFTYFFFRETAVEYINCGKVIYSRIGRMCKNDKGGNYLLKDNWTTFLKARLNCSLPGQYPFYYNEIQSVDYLELEQKLYVVFTTPENSIFGSAICIYNMTAVHSAFNGPFKYQASPKAAWERQSGDHEHFQCQIKEDSQFLLDSEKYQLMDDAVQPMYSQPVYTVQLERIYKIVVDVVPTKQSGNIHVFFVATVEGVIRKLVMLPNSKEPRTCLVEELHLSPANRTLLILSLKLLKDTNSLYIGTNEAVHRIPLHRCKNFLTKSECLNAMDPYCGWNEYQLACTTAPHRNPLSSFWHQQPITCPPTDLPMDGGWSPWSAWFECSQIGFYAPGDRCLCQQRHCTNPPPANGGLPCEGNNVQVANCTSNGQWTEWSAWSSCSQSCGLAVKTRRRTCGNPSPAYGGRSCVGPEKDETSCTRNPPCPVRSVLRVDGHWSEWTAWEECSAPCGRGIQTRRRRCTSPPPQNGGRECAGCDQDFRQCNIHQCPEVKKSSSWTPWLRSNSTREGYFEQRFRFTCRANILDSSNLHLSHVKKERFCLEDGQNCLDGAFVNIDGEWSDWSKWSECSVQCGGGIQYRERTCDNPPPSGNGLDCKSASQQERECNTHHCTGLELWEDWSPWSRCETKQEQFRQRRCKLPMQETQSCEGATRESRICVAPQPSLSVAEDGIHLEHVIGALFGGLVFGGAFGMLSTYLFMKRYHSRWHQRLNNRSSVKPNEYVMGNEWRNSKSIVDSPSKVKEATIKRNGQMRTPIHVDYNF